MTDMTQAQEDAYFERHDAPENCRRSPLERSPLGNDTPDNCFRLSDSDLARYQAPQAELVERLAANWHEVPHRNSYMMEVTAKRIQAALAHSGLKLAVK